MSQSSPMNVVAAESLRPVLDKAFERFQRDIAAHVDARLVELQSNQARLFEKLRRDLQGADHGAQSQNTGTGTIFFDEDDQVAYEKRASADFYQWFGCNTCANKNAVEAQVKWDDAPALSQHTNARGHQIHDDQKKNIAKPAVQVPSQPSHKSPLERPKPATDPTQELANSTKGEAKGSYGGRPNLFAFMQAKNWDSEAADEIYDSVETAVVAGGAENDESQRSMCDRFKSLILSSTFDLSIGLVIMANAIVMGIQLEYEAIFSADAIGLESDEGSWPNAKEGFAALEHFFAIFFLIELILRLAAMGSSYCKPGVHWLDAVLVFISMLEMYILPLIGAEFPSLNFLRVFRILKILKALRVVRVLSFFEKLRILVSAVSHSMAALFWSMMLLSLVQLISAVFMTQSLQIYLLDDSLEADLREQVYVFFGSFSRSLLTLFEMTLAAGTWGRCGRIIIFGVNRLYFLFFLGYLTFISFAMMRVIAAIFLKDTLSSAAKDSEQVMSEVNRDPDYVNQVRQVFRELDMNGDGEVTLHEMNVMLEDESLCEQVSKIGIQAHEVRGFFTLMDDGDDSISFCEFLTGVMRLKNAHKGLDLATLLYENKKLLSRVLKVGAQVDILRRDLGFKNDSKPEAEAKFKKRFSVLNLGAIST